MHSGLDWLRGFADGRAWLDRLPTRLDQCREQWSLELEEPYTDGVASLVVPAGDVVLKLQYPHRESEHEADALALWDGDGAVRLLAQDRERHALLLERCRPGTPLGDAGADAALDVLVGLLPRLWRPAGDLFRPLAEEAAWWLDGLEAKWKRAGSGSPLERRLLDAAVDALRELPGSQGEQVLVHQDLHAGNVLAAEREPWLVIDPKPLVGERAFGVAALVRGSELGHSAAAVVGRLDRLSSDLALDRDRARRWAIAQTVAWAGLSGDVHTEHLDAARWLLEAE